MCAAAAAARSNWLNYYKMWRMPVLVALNPADTALRLEAMSNAEVIADAMAVRRLCLIFRSVVVCWWRSTLLTPR